VEPGRRSLHAGGGLNGKSAEAELGLVMRSPATGGSRKPSRISAKPLRSIRIQELLAELASLYEEHSPGTSRCIESSRRIGAAERAGVLLLESGQPPTPLQLSKAQLRARRPPPTASL